MTSTLMRREIALLTVALICRPARGSFTETGNDAGNGGCTVTLSGARSASLGCSAATIGWSAAGNATGGAIAGTGSPRVLISFRLPGQLATRSYHNTDAGAVIMLAVSDGTREWGANVGGAAMTGSATLTITSLRTTTFTADARIYAAHGTLTATLQPNPSTHATGTVTLKATF